MLAFRCTYSERRAGFLFVQGSGRHFGRHFPVAGNWDNGIFCRMALFSELLHVLHWILLQFRIAYSDTLVLLQCAGGRFNVNTIFGCTFAHHAYDLEKSRANAELAPMPVGEYAHFHTFPVNPLGKPNPAVILAEICDFRDR